MEGGRLVVMGGDSWGFRVISGIIFCFWEGEDMVGLIKWCKVKNEVVK